MSNKIYTHQKTLFPKYSLVSNIENIFCEIEISLVVWKSHPNDPEGILTRDCLSAEDFYWRSTEIILSPFTGKHC